jgi:hypothetical protein
LVEANVSGSISGTVCAFAHSATVAQSVGMSKTSMVNTPLLFEEAGLSA